MYSGNFGCALLFYITDNHLTLNRMKSEAKGHILRDSVGGNAQVMRVT